jgi:hypothetical protein
MIRQLRQKKRLKLLALTLLSLMFLFTQIGFASAKELALIVNKSFPAIVLTNKDIKEIYMGQREMIEGIRLRPVDQDYNQAIRKAFMQRIIILPVDAYTTYWNNRIFQRGGIPPVLRKNSEEVVKTVVETDGAIGYIWLEEAQAVATRVKVLFTIDSGQQ